MRGVNTTAGHPRTVERDRIAAAALSELVEPGLLEYYALVVQHGPAGALDRLLAEAPGDVASADGEVAAAASAHGAALRRRLRASDPYERGAHLLEKAQRVGARLLIESDTQWPHQLTDLAALTVDDSAAAPPIALWVRGSHSLATICRKSVAIVGARAATSYGTRSTAELASGLTRRGWTVVSGAAYGIDGAAHRGALWADGLTVAVLACGVDRAYPIGHTRILERIADTGAVVSEWPPGSGPLRHRFLIRNRVIAGLARGVVVTESARRSGSRLTARRAQELGRAVMALPGPVTSPMSAGPHELLRDWQARLVTSAADVIAEVGELREIFDESESGTDPQLDAELIDRVMRAMPREASVSLLWLVGACEASPRQLRAILPSLVMRGLLIERSDSFARRHE
ncbi:MAG: DNA-processing protein DprA [Pseudonocardiaceae bacterium]